MVRLWKYYWMSGVVQLIGLDESPSNSDDSVVI